MKNETHLDIAIETVRRVKFTLFGKYIHLRVSYDKKGGDRLYIQAEYQDICRLTNVEELWTGRKWYLSEFMTEDEIIKTCYAACKACVEHEIMEAFTVDGIVLFNPHINFEELLAISHKEVRRESK